MIHQITERELTQRYREALHLCEADAGEDCRARVLYLTPHHKSTQAYVAVGEPAREPTHVIKFDTGAWDPKREFAGLEYVARAFQAIPDVGNYRLGAVTPVGYGLAPPFLVTRYQSGQSIRPVFDRAVRGFRPNPSLRAASEYCGAIARWLSVFRSVEPQAGGGLTPENYLRFCSERAKELSQTLNADRQANIVMACLERYVAILSEGDRALMMYSYPTHGDLAPQNFLVDDKHVLYALDLESFAFEPMNTDLTRFRTRMQEYACRGPFARRLAQDIWVKFWDAYTSQGSPTFALLSHLHGLLAHLAWMKNRNFLEMQKPRRLTTRLRTALWIRTALNWIEGLRGHLASDLEHLRSSL